MPKNDVPRREMRKSPTGSYRIVLVDDHTLFRHGLRMILQQKPDLEVIGEAGDGLELLKFMNQLIPHMIILDISMPNLRGIEAIREVKASHPDVRILMLTMHKDREYLHEAISAGADGYLIKEDAGIELLSAIEAIRQGKTYISPALFEELKADWIARTRDDHESLTADPLSERERQILKMIAEGKPNKEIADLFFISVRTVECHRANIREKLNLKKTSSLVKYAIEKGYVSTSQGLDPIADTEPR